MVVKVEKTEGERERECKEKEKKPQGSYKFQTWCLFLLKLSYKLAGRAGGYCLQIKKLA